MALSTTLSITDQMTAGLNAIHQANNQLLSDYRSLSGASVSVDTTAAVANVGELTGGLTEAAEAEAELSGGSVNLDTASAAASVEELTGGLTEAGEAQRAMRDEVSQTEERVRRARNEQERYNDSMARGRAQADGLAGSVKKLGAAFLGFFGISTAKNFIQNSLSAFDVQNNSERQLQTVLANVGASPDAFGNLAATASEIQGRTMYGDEAMLGGAAEFATYISDEEAVRSMMGTLSNYAAGMSGGGEVGKQQMVDYATQLGKALDGTYDGLLKKGFTLSDAQKEIIENGTDMEKALVLDEVINQSWAGLAEQMANTPQGKIIQFKNNLGDLTEIAGSRLYPAVLRLFDVANANMPQIEGMMTTFADGAAMVIYGVSGIADAGARVYQIISGNWGTIGPIVYGIAAAFTLYNGVLLAHSGYMAAASVWESVMAARQTILAIRTGTATAAQAGFNMTLLACPVTWVVGGIILVTAGLYALCNVINETGGTAYSVTGAIAGFFSTMATGVVRVFLWMGDIALGVLEAIAEGVDFVTGSNFAADIAATRDSLSDYASSNWSITAAWDKGYSWGSELENKVKNFDPAQLIGDLSGLSFDSTLSGGLSDTLGDIADDTSSIKKSLEMSEEELKYLRDIAEREVINRFTTAEIKIDMQNINQINDQQDIDGIMEALLDKVAEGVAVAAEG